MWDHELMLDFSGFVNRWIMRLTWQLVSLKDNLGVRNLKWCVEKLVTLWQSVQRPMGARLLVFLAGCSGSTTVWLVSSDEGSICTNLRLDKHSLLGFVDLGHDSEAVTIVLCGLCNAMGSKFKRSKASGCD